MLFPHRIAVDHRTHDRLPSGSLFWCWLLPPNVQGKPAAAKTAGRQKTGDPPLGLTDLLGDCSVCGSLNLSDAERLSFRRLTTRRHHLFWFRFGRRATFGEPNDVRVEVVCCGFGFVIKGQATSIRRTTIRRSCDCGSLFRHRTSSGDQHARDFMPGCVIVFWFPGHGPSDVISPDNDQPELCFASNASGTNHSRTSASPTIIRERARTTHRMAGTYRARGGLVVDCGSLRLDRPTTKFSSGAGCNDFEPRKAVMPAPSAATSGSARKP